MTNMLKKYHPSLFKRVRLKAILFSALGLSLIGAPTTTSPTTQKSVLHYLLPLNIWGFVFLFIGLAIALGLLLDNKSFKFLRSIIILTGGIAVMWFLALVIIAIQSHTSLSIAILWGYLTANLFYIGTDSGWDTSAIVEEIHRQSEEL